MPARSIVHETPKGGKAALSGADEGSRGNPARWPEPPRQARSCGHDHGGHTNMPYLISDSRRGVRALGIGLALALAAIIATPAHAAGITNPYDCTPQPTLSSAF